MGLNRDFRPVSTQGARRVRFYNNSGAAIAEGAGFNIVAGTVTVLADTNTVGLFGIACADVANGAYGECYVEGMFEVAVVGTINFAQGGAAYMASASGVDTGSTSDVPVGYIVTEDPASGAAKVTIEIVSTLKSLAAHA